MGFQTSCFYSTFEMVKTPPIKGSLLTQVHCKGLVASMTTDRAMQVTCWHQWQINQQQSYHVLEYQSHWIHYEQKFKDDTILPRSRVPKSPDPFWTKVQGWYNPTTFSSTEVTRSILNKSSRMIQSYHVLEYRSHRIHSEQNFKDDTILPHSRGPKSPDHFRTNVQGWYNPYFFLET